MKQAHLMISGAVQGVGYRYFVRNAARKLGINGWIRNTSNGKVEAVLQASEDTIEKMLSLCREGPMVAEVKDIEIEWEEAEQNFEDFQIR